MSCAVLAKPSGAIANIAQMTAEMFTHHSDTTQLHERMGPRHALKEDIKNGGCDVTTDTNPPT
jgi:hypothetical protein